MSWFVAQRRCESCEFTERLEKSALANWLKSCGRMKRDAKPEVPLMMELGKLDAAAASCPQCGAVGLVLEPPADEDEADWGDARRCESCHATIEPLRLEVFPDSTRCAACQAKEEQGELTSPEDVDYCSHCGGIMTVKMQGSGVSRYSMVCSDCGRR